MISPNNTVLLNLMKSSRKLQFVTGIYGLLVYLCSYMCKEEGKPGETMRKVIHKDIFACLFSIHNTISLSCHEQVCLSGQTYLNILKHTCS